MKLLLTIAFVFVVASNTFAQDDNWSWGDLDSARIKGGAVEYVPPKKLKMFPVPVLLFVNDKDEFEDLREEVIDKIIYPFLCESEVPIVLIKVDLCPVTLGAEDDGKRGCDKGEGSALMIRLDISGSDGSESMGMIERNKTGGFDKDTHLKLLPGGFVPRGRCAVESSKK
jgi:hypothetical protein